MPSTLTTLLRHCLDFAGLFPPASLGVTEALRQFRMEQSSSPTEMLARFVCPVLRLEELASAAAAKADPKLGVAVLPRGGKNTGEFLANLETDLATIQRIAQLNCNVVTIDTLEMRPPPDALQQPALRKLVSSVHALLARRTSGVRQVFIELAPSPQLASQLEILAEHLVRGGIDPSLSLGYKLRTGGSDAAAAPSPAQVATALGAVAAFHLPMKCTGGLHHPLRGHGANPMHGFINLLVAAAFAATGRVEPGLVEAVLEETDPSAFSFDTRNVAWREHRLTPGSVARGRDELLLSFGSCYADQPRLELLRLGWWPKPAKARMVGVGG